MRDLVLDKNFRKGSAGKKVKLIQEWLCLNDFNILIDGDFGLLRTMQQESFK